MAFDLLVNFQQITASQFEFIEKHNDTIYWQTTISFTAALAPSYSA